MIKFFNYLHRAEAVKVPKETYWSQQIADEMNGEAEVRLFDGVRIDVLTDEVAWEVEWPEKWAESIGQAIYYRASTDKQGGVILLVGRGPYELERSYYQRCLVCCKEAGLLLKTYKVE